MASIRERKRKTGTVGYAVLWRHGGVQTSLTFDTLPAAEHAQRLIEATGADPDQVADLVGPAGPAGHTLTEALRAHVAELTGVAERTRADYLRDAARHIDPVLGPLPVAAIDKTAVSTWVNRLDQSELSDKTIRNLHGLLSSAMATAVEKGWASSNPCRGMRLPTRAHGDEEMVFLTRQEWALLLSEIPDYWQPLYTFLAGTGVRWGEAVGLTVGHVDLRSESPAVRINQADKRTPNGRALGTTKTRRGRRTITLPEQVVAALAPLLDRPASARLFVTRRGGALNRSHYGQVWQPAVARACDPEWHGAAALSKTPRIHDLRHTHASWLIAAGVDLLTVSRRLGHESITITSDRYGHLLPDQQRRAAEAATWALTPG